MSADFAALEARIIELEIRYSHQEATLETLSDLVREQHDTIEKLRRALQALRAQAGGGDEGSRLG